MQRRGLTALSLPRACALFALGVCDVAFFVALALACDALTPILAGRVHALVAVYVAAGLTFLGRAADYYRLFRNACLYRTRRTDIPASASYHVVALYSLLAAALAFSTTAGACEPMPAAFTGAGIVWVLAVVAHSCHAATRRPLVSNSVRAPTRTPRARIVWTAAEGSATTDDEEDGEDDEDDWSNVSLETPPTNGIHARTALPL